MRGFTDTKQPTKPSLGDATYNFFIKQAEKEKETGKKTEEAKQRYKTPPYCYGEARRRYEEEQRRQEEERKQHEEEGEAHTWQQSET